MEVIQIVVIILLVALIIPRFLPVKGVQQITANELSKRLKEKNVHLIDVRTPGEYQAHHIKEFTNIPLHQLRHEAHKLSKDKEIIVICRSGNRSMQACRRLKRLGFEKLTNVSGGMNTWR